MCLFFLSSYSFAQTHLLLFGRGQRPVEAMKTFAHIAGKDKSDILIIPWASESVESAEAIKLELSNHSMGQFKIIPHVLSPKDVTKLFIDIEKRFKS